MDARKLRHYALAFSAVLVAGVQGYDQFEKLAARAERDGEAATVGARGQQADVEAQVQAALERRREAWRARRRTRQAKLVRDCWACGVDVWGECREWVQPCLREDQDGCSEACRPPKNECERAQADARAVDQHGAGSAFVDQAYERIRQHCPERLDP